MFTCIVDAGDFGPFGQSALKAVSYDVRARFQKYAATELSDARAQQPMNLVEFEFGGYKVEEVAKMCGLYPRGAAHVQCGEQLNLIGEKMCSSETV